MTVIMSSNYFSPKNSFESQPLFSVFFSIPTNFDSDAGLLSTFNRLKRFDAFGPSNLHSNSLTTWLCSLGFKFLRTVAPKSVPSNLRCNVRKGHNFASQNLRSGGHQRYRKDRRFVTAIYDTTTERSIEINTAGLVCYVLALCGWHCSDFWTVA